MRRAWTTAAATALAVPALVVGAGDGALAGVTTTCDGEAATISGTTASETIVGTPARDVIAGLGGKDDIQGLAGNDLICGGRGIDTIDAGKGDDTVYGGGDGAAVYVEGDFVEGGPGDDDLHGGEASDESGGDQKDEDVVVYDNAPRGIDITLGEATVTGQGTDTIDGFNSVFGSKHADDITAGAETDLVKSLGGADTLKIDSNEGEVFGGDGNDVIRLGKFVYGGSGDDKLINARADVFGGNGDDLLLGRPHRDEFYGGGGDDVLRGRSGPDFIRGDDGDDRLVGGGGADALQGRYGADRILGGEGDDLLEPGDNVVRPGSRSHIADDAVHGGSGSDTVTYPQVYRSDGVRVDLREGLATRAGRDRLRGVENALGGPKGDELLGDAGRNLLTGNGGNDRIVGRGGADTADGVNGTDRCAAETEIDCER